MGRPSPNIRRAVFGVDDELALIETVVVREHVADGDDDGKHPEAFAPEEFHAHDKRGQRRVGDTAEHGDHGQGRTDFRRNSQKAGAETAECGTDEEGRDDFAALVSAGQRDCREQEF